MNPFPAGRNPFLPVFLLENPSYRYNKGMNHDWLAFIREQKDELRITDDSMAVFLHTSTETVSEYLSGKTEIPMALWSHLAHVLELDLTGLLTMVRQKENTLCDQNPFRPREFGFALASLRKACGRTPDDVSAGLNISKEELANYEHSTVLPTYSMFMALIRYYGVTPEMLYFGKDVTKNSSRLGILREDSRRTEAKSRTLTYVAAGVLLIISIVIAWLLFFRPFEKKKQTNGSSESVSHRTTETVQNPTSIIDLQK